MGFLDLKFSALDCCGLPRSNGVVNVPYDVINGLSFCVFLAVSTPVADVLGLSWASPCASLEVSVTRLKWKKIV